MINLIYCNVLCVNVNKICGDNVPLLENIEALVEKINTIFLTYRVQFRAPNNFHIAFNILIRLIAQPVQ